MLGRLLKIDLSSGKIQEEAIPADYMLGFIGGSGLGVRLLWDYLVPGRDPFDPKSPLLWMTGPLTGSGGPTPGRFSICGRSPQTGLWGEANIGGFVGPELRFAGYDAVLITGKASSPVYLWIHNGKVEICAANHLWGKTDIYSTQKAIKGELNEPMARVASIGLAGENLVKMAGILSDNGRAAGRTGMGALMGSKNLKALAVRGTGKLPLERLDVYKRLRVAANKDLLNQNMTEVYRATGTSGAVDYLQILGDMPQKYWTQATFDGAGQIGGGAMAETILVGTSACQGCIISCGREVEIKEGVYQTRGKVKGPEYETICSFGSQLLVDNLALITAIGNHCDALGIDTISAGNTIALAYYLFDQGIISTKDTGDVELHWGDAKPCFGLLDQMARKEGFGELLAKGSKALAAHYGVEELAVHVNNLEVPMHDPRAVTGQALVYVTSPRGACHNQGDYFQVEIGGALEELDIPMTDRLSSDDKAIYVARHQDYKTVCNSLVVCFFASVKPSTLVELLSAATGHDWTLDEMMKAGERAWNLKRIYNGRLGLTRASEKLPKLLLQPLPDGGQEGTIPNMDVLLDGYYEARDWDAVSGQPHQKKIEELSLDFVLV